MPKPDSQRMPKPMRFIPLQDTVVASKDPHGFQCRSRAGIIEIRALREDVFRLRVARGRTLPEFPSWAVTPLPADCLNVRFLKTARKVGIHTSAGRVILRLAD